MVENGYFKSLKLINSINRSRYYKYYITVDKSQLKYVNKKGVLINEGIYQNGQIIHK